MPYMTGIMLIGLGIQANNFAGWFGASLGILHLIGAVAHDRAK